MFVIRNNSHFSTRFFLETIQVMAYSMLSLNTRFFQLEVTF